MPTRTQDQACQFLLNILLPDSGIWLGIQIVSLSHVQEQELLQTGACRRHTSGPGPVLAAVQEEGNIGIIQVLRKNINVFHTWCCPALMSISIKSYVALASSSITRTRWVHVEKMEPYTFAVHIMTRGWISTGSWPESESIPKLSFSIQSLNIIYCCITQPPRNRPHWAGIPECGGKPSGSRRVRDRE